VGFSIRDIHASSVHQQDNSNTFIAGPGAVMHIDAARQVTQLRQIVSQLPMNPAAAAAAQRELSRAEFELATPQPQRTVVGDSLERFTKIAQSAGALASASQAIHGPLAALAHWLGDRGRPILELLASQR
jgi:hypothetical protein